MPGFISLNSRQQIRAAVIKHKGINKINGEATNE